MGLNLLIEKRIKNERLKVWLYLWPFWLPALIASSAFSLLYSQPYTVYTLIFFFIGFILIALTSICIGIAIDALMEA